MAYSSLGTQWPTERDSFGYYHNPVLTHPTIVEIADKHSVSAADVVLSWVIQEGGVALPRASRGDHLASNIRLLHASDQLMRCHSDDLDSGKAGDDESTSGVCPQGDTGARGGGASVFLDQADITRIRQLHGTRSR